MKFSHVKPGTLDQLPHAAVIPQCSSVLLNAAMLLAVVVFDINIHCTLHYPTVYTVPYTTQLPLTVPYTTKRYILYPTLYLSMHNILYYPTVYTVPFTTHWCTIYPTLNIGINCTIYYPSVYTVPFTALWYTLYPTLHCTLYYP